jgi:RimJ/RimL family protein N-acetyltransferase
MKLYEDYLKETYDNKFTMYSDQYFLNYCVVEGDQLYIEDFYIVPEKRNTDLAKEVIDELEVKAKELGCNYIINQTMPHNMAVIKLNEKCNFTKLKQNNDHVYFCKEIK